MNIPAHCISPQNTAIVNHRANLTGIWQTPEWIAESEAYKQRHPPVCSRCGREGPIVPGHCEEDYNDMATYVQKVRDDQVVPLCHQCNKMESKGRHPCPSCIEQHRADPAHWIRYIGRDAEVCPDCRSPEEKQQIANSRLSQKIFLRLIRDKDNARRRAAYQANKKAVKK